MAPTQAQRRSPNAAHTSGTAAATARTLGAVERGAHLGPVEPTSGAVEAPGRGSRRSGVVEAHQRRSKGARVRRDPRSDPWTASAATSGANLVRGGGQAAAPGHEGRTSGAHQGAKADTAQTLGPRRAPAARQPKLGQDQSAGTRARQPSLWPVERISGAVEAPGSGWSPPRRRGSLPGRQPNLGHGGGTRVARSSGQRRPTSGANLGRVGGSVGPPGRGSRHGATPRPGGRQQRGSRTSGGWSTAAAQTLDAAAAPGRGSRSSGASRARGAHRRRGGEHRGAAPEARAR